MQAKSDQYLTILFGAGAATSAGLIPLLIRAIPKIVKWFEARAERKKMAQEDALTKAQAKIEQYEARLRADYETRLREKQTELEHLRAENARLHEELRKEIREHRTTSELALRALEKRSGESSVPPKSPMTSGTNPPK
jgi:hypothetical protein